MAPVHIHSPVVGEKENKEMVVVTYEEGLARLGLNQPDRRFCPGPTPVSVRQVGTPVQLEEGPPRSRSGRHIILMDSKGRLAGVDSTWLPSYYRQYDRDDGGESELGYRT